MAFNNLGRYLVEDIEYYKRNSTNEDLSDLLVDIYTKNSQEPYTFSAQSKYSMRDNVTLMIEQISFNPPMRNVFNADDISSYSFFFDDEDADKDNE